MKPVICLMGPTAVGKSSLALTLATRLPLSIISVDSTMLYKGMDIGSAKPSLAEREQVPHYLIDLLDPSETYSAANFCRDAELAIQDCYQQNRIPMLVGGTMLYYHALQKGLAELPPADATIRAEILKQAEVQGWDALHDELQQIDPQAAQRIHPNDPQRLQRALEVYRLTGKSLTEHWQTSQQKKSNYDFINISLLPTSRAQLHETIKQRLEQMLAAGFIDEVKCLFQRDELNLELPSIRSVGYRQVWMYLEKRFTYDQMLEKAIVATRQLAKRQLTWLNKWPKNELFYTNDENLGDKVFTFLHKACYNSPTDF